MVVDESDDFFMRHLARISNLLLHPSPERLDRRIVPAACLSRHWLACPKPPEPVSAGTGGTADALVAARPDAVRQPGFLQLATGTGHEPLLHGARGHVGQHDAGFAADCSGEMAEPIASWQAGYIGRDGLGRLPSAELPARDAGGHLGQPVCADGAAGILLPAPGRGTVPAGNALHLPAAHCGALLAAEAVDGLAASLPEATTAICGPGPPFRSEAGLLACGAAGRGGHPAAMAASGDPGRLAGRARAGCGIVGPEPEGRLEPLRLPGRLRCAPAPLASAPSAFKAFACAFSAAISAACEAMGSSSRVLACRLRLAGLPSIPAAFLSLDALMAAHPSDARLRSRARMPPRAGLLPSARHGAPFASAPRRCAQARPVRLQPIGPASRPAGPNMAPGLSPPWQRRMNSRLNSLEQAILGGSARSTASSERRCLGSSSANIPLCIDKPSLPGLAARFYLTINLGVRNAGSRSTSPSRSAPPLLGTPSLTLGDETSRGKETSAGIHETLGDEVDWDPSVDKADRLDYLVAAASGVISGLIDTLWVGEFSLDRASSWGEDKVERFVIRVARSEGYNGDDLAGAIRKLEKNHPFAVDGNANAFGGGLQHHLRDFSHHFGIDGLLFSVFTQFTGLVVGTDLSGALRVVPVPESYRSFIGKNLQEKLTFGTIGWFFHMVSDMAGSGGSLMGGTGIPGPIVSLIKDVSALPLFRGGSRGGAWPAPLGEQAIQRDPTCGP